MERNLRRARRRVVNSKTFAYWDFTQDGRLKRETGATGRYVDYSYDTNGNVLTLTDQLARTTRTHYDELNRTTRVVGPLAGAAYPVTCMKYDNLSRVTELWAGSSTDQNAITCDLSGSDLNLKKQASYQCLEKWAEKSFACPTLPLASGLSFPTSCYFSNIIGGGGAGGQTMSGISPRP